LEWATVISTYLGCCVYLPFCRWLNDFFLRRGRHQTFDRWVSVYISVFMVTLCLSLTHTCSSPCTWVSL
jgi:hypothetical protein